MITNRAERRHSAGFLLSGPKMIPSTHASQSLLSMPRPKRVPITGTSSRPGREPVDGLWVLCNNVCNMACPDCFIPITRRPSEARRLPWEDLEGALDHFLASGPRRAKVVTVFGGEPFMDYPLLRRMALRLKRSPYPPLLEIYTNGTLAKPEMVLGLAYPRLRVFVSLDGDKTGNDRYRVFGSRSSRSVHDAVLRGLERLPVESLAVNAVVHPENMDGLLESLDRLSRRGIRTIDMIPDLCRPWAAASIRRLGEFSKEFARYYAGRTEAEDRPPFYSAAVAQAIRVGAAILRGEVWWERCPHLILGCDGNYYACEGSLYEPRGVRVAADVPIGRGRRGEGPDWEARRRFMDEANRFLRRMEAPRCWQAACPVLYYKFARRSGADPAASMDQLHAVSQAFLMPLAELALRLGRQPAFRECYLPGLSDAALVEIETAFRVTTSSRPPSPRRAG